MDTDWLPSFDRLDDAAPHARLLSNGRLTTLITSAGTGYSAWGDFQLTAWDGDRVEDGDGWFFYLRDLDRGEVWSAGHQPFVDAAGEHSARCAPGAVVLGRRAGDIESTLAVCVAPDADVEVRRLTLTNHGDERRRIEVTSYFQVILNYRAAHVAHPAFSRLFVETEWAAEQAALLARRRPRSAGEKPPWLGCALLGPGGVEFDSDRARVIGRNRSGAEPAMFAGSASLAGTVGSVLDPVCALRRVVDLPPGTCVVLDALLAGGSDRTAVLAALAGAAAPAALASVFARAGAHAEAAAAAAGIDLDRATAYQAFLGAMMYGHPALRADASTIARAGGSAEHLGITYNLWGAPLAVACVDDDENAGRAREIVTAQGYWLRHGVRADAVVLCGAAVSAAAIEAIAKGKADGANLLVRRREELPAADVDLILAAARLVVWGDLPRLDGSEAPIRSRQGGAAAAAIPGREDDRRESNGKEALGFDNGIGGFGAGGSEYVIRVDGELRPPLAWVNVIANEHFGFLASENGAAHTWSRNSQLHRITPWYNDPLRDPHGEALYVRDDDSGELWSPQPGPAAAAGGYEVRHGFGYSTWRHNSHGLEQEVTAFVPSTDPLRVLRLRLTNHGQLARRVSIVSYQRLVLGVQPGDSGRYVVTEHDSNARTLLARNRAGGEFAGAEVFAAAVCESAARLSWSTDRASFIGRNGSPRRPVAVAAGGDLDARAGAGLDACFALQLAGEIAPGATFECAFLLGDAAERNAAAALVARYGRLAAVDAALASAREAWRDRLTAVQVETPVPAIDVMVNGWLLYQVLSCRLWGRTALYQSGGAFGFRDQLQDAAALVYSCPALTRAQIILHAEHQFPEGDVLHWWHPPLDRGTRTRISDDLLWLPYVACLYAGATGDWALFDEQVPFSGARTLAPGEEESYLQPTPGAAVADLYTHCVRAVDHSLTRGAHGLPLMGTGDWNDGMNRVGREGRGESVWLGFFLDTVLDEVIPLCERRGDRERVARYTDYRDSLRQALDTGGWDGGWYRRAYYDDGTPLGSAQNLECRIDAIAQAWAAISGAAPAARARQALDAVEEHLVDPSTGIIRLLAPAFDRDPHDPGYIKGYVPGIRENGGQYTHGATWVVRACAELGLRDRAARHLEKLTPASHGGTAKSLAVYQVEPYVMAADIYGVEPHLGRGGWTWYTGSAGWTYRVALESVLGVRMENGATLVVDPRVPDSWPGFRVCIRLADRTTYEVAVVNPTGAAAKVVAIAVDGTAVPPAAGVARVALVRDGGRHAVEVTLGG